MKLGIGAQLCSPAPSYRNAGISRHIRGPVHAIGRIEGSSEKQHMRVFINARFLTQSITGVQRYAVELIKALDRLIDSGEVDSSRYSFTLLSPRDRKSDLGLVHIPLKQVGCLRGHLWEQFELPLYTRGRDLLSLCNAAPLFKRNQVVTIHDAAVFAVPGTYPIAFRAWYQVLLQRLCRTSAGIITDSAFSKSELIKYCRPDPTRVHVIYLGKEHVFSADSDESILEKHGLGTRPFVLAVSSMTFNKNFRSIVRAIELLGRDCFDTAIVGGVNPRVFTQSNLPLSDTVKHLGYVTDGELRALYEHAACFIFPSFYEGFGLPPLEAMACGCPVITSNAASLPEVCGDAALYCDPYSPEDIAAKIALLMSDEALRDSLHKKGLARARQFTWEQTARQTLEVYREALAP